MLNIYEFSFIRQIKYSFGNVYFLKTQVQTFTLEEPNIIYKGIVEFFLVLNCIR